MNARRICRDEGSALLLVMGVMTSLLLLVSVSLTYALQTQTAAVRSTSWNQALAAAQAGVDDYLARLNRRDLYWRSVDCTNVAMQRAYTSASPCAGWGPSTATGWLTVPGSRSTARPAQFHYDITTAQTAVDGTISIVSTGRAGGLTRTIDVTLRRAGFGEYLYLTEYETVDPANEAVFGYNNTAAATECTRHFWDSPSRTSKCYDIQFTTGDVIAGPLHSNDAIVIAGTAKFSGPVTTSYPNCRSTTGTPKPASSCYRAGSSPSPTFSSGITYRDSVGLPASVANLRQYVTAGSTDNLGCLYTGPTRIKFSAPGSGAGKMQVWSKWSTSVNPGCGTPGTGSGQLGSANGQLVDVPDNKLILVQNVPSSSSSPASGACATGAVGDGLPAQNDYNATLQESNCRYGTAFVEGTVKGRVTLAADNNVVVTGDLKYAGGASGSDVLGLIAENSVQIYHPVKQTCSGSGSSTTCSYSNLGGANASSVLVNAAILTLKHSFTVQSYDKGADLGTLSVYGSIAQKFRGPVGTSGGSGYLKDYSYDTRLRYSPPPYFLDPVESGWGQKTFGEVAARYRTS